VSLRAGEAIETLNGFIKARVDCAIIGETQSGKIALARTVAPNAPIVHGFELSNDYLSAIRSRLVSSKIVIVKNLTQESAKLLEPILATRTIFGERFDCVFIITSRQNLAIEGCATLKLSPIDADEWLRWAKKTRVHPALITLAEEDKTFLSRHNLRTIDALSKTLSARPSAKTLDKAIGAFLGEDKEAIVALVTSLSAPISSLSEVQIATYENAKAYENAFMESIKTDPSADDISRFVEYISSIASDAPTEALNLLRGLLNSQKAAHALEKILKEKRAQEIIDGLIAKVD
jgi:hypothetical protein